MKVDQLMKELEKFPRDADVIMRYVDPRGTISHDIDSVGRLEPSITSLIGTRVTDVVVLEWRY